MTRLTPTETRSDDAPGVLPPGIDDQARPIFELLGSTRAMRHLRPDPVAPALLEALVWAATRASSPSNSQLWHFVIVTEPERRAAIRRQLVTFERWTADLVPSADADEQRMRDNAGHLLEHLAAAPALIVVCAEHAYPTGAPHLSYVWSAVGTATQNLLVAARALGLGATLTMFHIADEAALATTLGLPENVRIGAIVPVGWPAKPFGPVRRRPLREVMHREHW